MRRHRPRNRMLLWATRSLVFRTADDGPRDRRPAPGEARPFRAAREIDWVSWLAGIPEPVEDLSKPLDRASDDLATAPEPIEVSGSSLRVSLKIRHTI